MIYPSAGIPTSTGSAWGTSITNNSTNWNTAYSERLRWDGSSTGLNAATGRTSLGATEIGSNLFTLNNPNSQRYLRTNNDNTIATIPATTLKVELALDNVTNESKATMFTNPTFTGTAVRWGTDTLATRAEARAGGGLTAEEVGEQIGDSIRAGVQLGDVALLLQDTASMLAPYMLQNKAGMLNVLDYGAVNNDNRSDTAAINEAIRDARKISGAWGDETIVYIPSGIYNIDGGITMYARVSLIIAKNAVFYVSSGYEGACIVFPDNAKEDDFLVQGGYFIEQSPRQYKWTGIKMHKSISATQSYSIFGEIRDVTFYGCGIGIDISLANNSWINECVFERINFRDFKIGVKQVEVDSTNTQFRGNKFIACGFQGGDSTLIGVQLSENQNMFIGCSFWDWSKSDQPSPAFVIDTGQDNEFIGTYRSYDLGIFTSQHDNNAQDMKVAQATIRYTQEGVADTIAYLPNLAIVWNVKVRVTTNFNDSGTDLLDVGTSASGSSFINDLDISTGSGQFSSSNLSNPLMIWGNNYITARYDGQNNNATAGEVRIWIHYTLR